MRRHSLSPLFTAPGRLIAVWSPGGSPGCSTVAAGLAAILARSCKDPLILVDGDLTRGGLTHLLHQNPTYTLGTALALPRREDEPCAHGHLQGTAWNGLVLPGVPGPGAPVEIPVGAYSSLLQRLKTCTPLLIVDVGDELPPREHGDGHLAALRLADVIVVVGAATDGGRDDLLLEYPLLDMALHVTRSSSPRRLLVNHMPESDILVWRRLARNSLDLPLIGQLPHDWSAMSRSRRQHVPFPIVDPSCAAAKCLERIADRVMRDMMPGEPQ